MTFVSGDVYDYFDVPPKLATDWRAAISKGEFFAAHIRDRYGYRLVERAWR